MKPEVVEIGGDLVYSKNPPRNVRHHTEVAVELLNSTMHNAPAYSKDGAGTSFAAPKVAHIAAHIQNLSPAASPLLYRALIVQSARWPGWAEDEANWWGIRTRRISVGVAQARRLGRSPRDKPESRFGAKGLGHF